MINEKDMEKLNLQEGSRVTVKKETGEINGQKVAPYPIKEGGIMMYYPESNRLVPGNVDPQSKTPSFKSIEVLLEKEL